MTYNARLLSNRCFATPSAAIPKLRAYTPTMDAAELLHHHHENKLKRSIKLNYVPVYVALGMIALSMAFGLHVAKQHLLYAPDVRMKKSRREKLTEVEEPEIVAEEAENFIKRSFFRKVAHVQEFEIPVPATIRGDVLASKPRVEALKIEARRG